VGGVIMSEIMTVNGVEYRIIKLLGKGKGGYSYLVEKDNSKYVLKQIHHEPCDYYQFGDKIQSEIRDYKRLKSIGINIPEMLDVDVEKERILKEYIDGKTIDYYVKNDLMKQDYINQVKKMCEVLYKNNLNIDYFPTNFVVKNDTLHYIDFECNTYMNKWDFENWGIKYWSKTKEFIEHFQK
jgi:tRNA A-37 threonylcarbamoyl transferase component Bud32